MNIVERLTATSQQLQDAGLERRAAGAIAAAIAAAQEENSERMNAMEEAIKDMSRAIKALGEKLAETNRRVDALEEAVKDMNKAIKALSEKMVETNQRMAEYQIATEQKIASATGWAMVWKLAALQAPLYVAMLGNIMQWW